MAVETKLLEFFSHYPTCKFRKNETIVRPDSASSAIFYIQSGYVRMYRLFNDGKEITLNIFKPGSYFPMMSTLSNLPNLYYFEAFTPTNTYWVEKESVLNFLKTNPDVLFDLTTRLAAGICGLLSNFERIISASACQRILSTLIILANRFGEITKDKKILITLSLSHEDVARLACLTRETTSLEMKKLFDSEVIFYKRRCIVINDLEQLNLRLNMKNLLTVD